MVATEANELSRWYDEHAAEYQAQTQSAELMAAERSKFLRRLEEAGAAAGTVLDLGAGVGRDALAFSQAGLTVRACDASSSMAALASLHSGVRVEHATFDATLRTMAGLDGIWACASLLHLRTVHALVDTLELMGAALRPGGVAYVSFKQPKHHSDAGRVRLDADGRRFLDMDEMSLRAAVGACGDSLIVESCWTTDDRLEPERPTWLSAFLVATEPSAPSWVAAIADAPSLPTRNPAENPAGWVLAHVDVETTGLAPGYHEMIDVGVVMTDMYGAELDPDAAHLFL